MHTAARNSDRVRWIIAAMILLLGAAAVAGDSFPGREPDRRVWNIQKKVLIGGYKTN